MQRDDSEEAQCLIEWFWAAQKKGQPKNIRETRRKVLFFAQFFRLRPGFS
jgi:hypothetical protein